MENHLIESAKQKVNYWWVSLLVGILAVIVGIMSSVSPLVTVGILTVFFIANFFVSGLFDIFFAISNRQDIKGWGWVLTGGIISVIFACILLTLPIGSMVIFIYYISFYVMLQSFMGMWGAFTLKQHEYKNWWVFLLIAILGFILSLLLMFMPEFAVGFITVIFSASLICYGLYRIFYSFRLKKMKDLFE